jgi:hypothetical protein
LAALPFIKAIAHALNRLGMSFALLLSKALVTLLLSVLSGF